MFSEGHAENVRKYIDAKLGFYVFVSLVRIACSRLSDSKDGISQFRRTDYLGAWNRLRYTCLKRSLGKTAVNNGKVKILYPNQRKTIVNPWERCLENNQMVINSGFPTVNCRK